LLGGANLRPVLRLWGATAGIDSQFTLYVDAETRALPPKVACVVHGYRQRL
jgi:hypothetical protein